MPLDRLEMRAIGGYVYQSAVPLGGSQEGRRGLPPKPVLWLLLRLHPTFRRRLARCKQAMQERLDRTLIDRWYREWRPGLIADIERWRRVDPGAFSDRELADHLQKLSEWTLAGASVHFELSVAHLSPLARLAMFCRDRLGYSDGQVLPLLSGLSEASSEPARELARLAALVRTDDELREAVLSAEPADVPGLLAERRADAAAKFREYLHHYGFRALRYEVAEETLGERPQLVAALLQDELRRPTDLETEPARLEGARAEARATALGALRDEAERHEFVDLLTDAERAYPIREDNEFFTVSVPLALGRFSFLEAGRRLAAANVLAAQGDIFFLQYEEISAALTGTSAAYGELVDQRRQEYAAMEAFDPPTSYGTRPPAPPLAVFPPEARLALQISAFALERVFEPERSNRREETGAPEIRGIPASRGIYEGPARIIMGEEEFDALQAGDVLVCPITSPVWSVLFAKVGALVTDSGGILSHPAIIAREYGMPAVVATGNATQVIRDGQRVEVDGAAGIVRLVG